MAGRKKAYDWKSQHVEAQLVKMGLEELDRDRDSKARKRKQVTAKHSARSSAANQHHNRQNAPTTTAAASLHQNNRLTPGLAYHEQQHQQPQPPQPSAYYGQATPAPAAEHYRESPYETAQQLAQELGAHPPDLDDAQREQLVNHVLDRTPFDLLEDQDSDDGEDAEAKLSDYSGGGHPHHHQQQQHHQHQHHHQQEQHPHGLPHPHWEARPRAGSSSLIHPALSGNSHGNNSTGAYGGPVTSGAPSSSSTIGGAAAAISGGPSGGSPDPFDAQRSTPMSRSMMEETLSRSSYGASIST